MPESVPWTTEFKEEALAAGIDLIGVTSAAPLRVQGPDERDARTVDPADALPDARAVVVAGFNVGYSAQPRPSVPGALLLPPAGGRGRDQGQRRHRARE